MKTKLILLALLLLSCSPVRGCVETSFTLAPDSRLPAWFSIPSDYTRKDLTVTLYYYSAPFPVNDVVFVMSDQYDNRLASVSGTMCWHPETEKKRHDPGFNPDADPYFVYVRANGRLEVIEHSNKQTFRISDDVKLVKEAVESKKCYK